MIKSAYIFPGQGGQFVGQGKAWHNSMASVRHLFRLADEVTDKPITRLCFEGPIEELSLTSNLQPAVLTVSLAGALVHLEKGVIPSFAAGHSLGEFGALCLAGVFTEAETLTLVNQRAGLMQRAAMQNPGTMAAILNLDAAVIENICELARAEGIVVLANFNTPAQTVISGSTRAVSAAVKFAQAKGGRAISLPVSGAFHSPLMKECGQAFSDLLREVDFKKPRFPVIPNALGTPVEDPDELKNLLQEQITSPVYWVRTIETLSQLGVEEYAECWPRPYLSSMVKKNLPDKSSARVICPS
ncbi:MAG: ACP S-malonyltransferase [Deltaproteobacteria bacterium]|nr:ACP S-malonyltransferase [Deltaproteobacteria bacterium]